MDKGIWIAGGIALVVLILLVVQSTNDDQDRTPPPVPAPPPRPESGVKQESLQCLVCKGYGNVMVPGTSGTSRRICPFCLGKGGRILRIPPGHVRCPDCGGFGKIPRPGDEASFNLCGRCGGRGFIRAPFQPSL